MFLLPLWEQTWIAILFQDAPSGSSAGPAGCGFSAKAVPRQCQGRQQLRRGYTSSEPFLQKGGYTSWGPLRSPNFVRQGPPSLVMSPIRLQTDLVQVHFFVRPFISPVHSEGWWSFPAHCTCSLGHFLRTKCCLLSPDDTCQPQTSPGQGTWWQLMHSLWSLWWLCWSDHTVVASAGNSLLLLAGEAAPGRTHLSFYLLASSGKSLKQHPAHQSWGAHV